MTIGLFGDTVIGVALSTAVNKLLSAIEGVIKTSKQFKPVLNQLKNTVSWITPRIKEISRRSKGSPEIETLLSLLNQAKEAVERCSGVRPWNYYKKYKLAKEIVEIDNSIRTMMQVFFPVMILEDTKHILDAVDELKLMFSFFFSVVLEDFHSGAKHLGLEKIAKSQPANIASDIALWKTKKLSGTLLFSSTATWLLQEVYQHNFLTIVSWLAIFFVTSLFIWRKVNRFVDKTPTGEEVTKFKLDHIREKIAMEVANACGELTDKAIRWVFQVTDAEKEWFVFPQTVAILLIFSYVGSFFDLPKLCEGVMMGTTIPVTVAKNWDKVRSFGNFFMELFEHLLDEIAKNNVVRKGKNNKKVKKQN